MHSILRRLENYSKRGLLRKQKIITKDFSSENCIFLNKKKYINFSSNDYLGVSNHTEIIEHFSNAAKKHGFGSGSSALICGYSDAHAELEESFAKWLNVDSAIFFNSGYTANSGVISALCDRGDIIFSDKLCHASLLDGIHLSRSKQVRYKHCDLQHLTQLTKTHKPSLIVTESVFSMEGDIAPVKQIAETAKDYQAGLLIDDAHGIGWLGNMGGGVCEQQKITQEQFTCLVLPLGKAFNGTGCIVAGRNKIIESVLQFSKTYRYTTALPAAICATLKKTLQIVIDEQWRRDQLKNNIHLFLDHAKSKKLLLSSWDETPIKSILIKSNEKTRKIQEVLLSKGFYTPSILPPTVPHDSARLRISLNCHHTESQIIKLLDCIVGELK